MQVSQAIRTKRAIRSFSDEPIKEADVQTILNAGRRAQSAKNRQPWHFIAIQDKERLKGLSEYGTYAGHLAGAALAVAILTPDPAQRWSIMFDAGQAAAYMQLAGWSLGIGSCPATIYKPEEARAILGFPEEYHLNVCLSFGYPQDPKDLTDPPQSGGRKPKEEIFHYETW
ncbi:MAG: nitroreductase family protein [Anaerolineales bacterium]